MHVLSVRRHTDDPPACLSRQIDAINDKFAEARDEIDYANEDAESTYFDESYKAAETVTNEARPRLLLRWAAGSPTCECRSCCHMRSEHHALHTS